ncbi:proline-rich protein 36-like [Neofelis nebulosa]|uniref:proline-rich protein 36-like n=1 Tax=Neofelis nebulosa TaxID=61452 RepID=UPI00272C8118|nr:proline-rich protein 36-like [Neofelis nebulosa]
MRPAPSLALTFEAATSPGSKAWLRLSLAPGRPARRVPELPVPAFCFAREGDKRFQGTCCGGDGDGGGIHTAAPRTGGAALGAPCGRSARGVAAGRRGGRGVSAAGCDLGLRSPFLGRAPTPAHPTPPDPGPGLGFGECACLPLPVCARARACLCALACASASARVYLCACAPRPLRGGPLPPPVFPTPSPSPLPFPSPSRSPAAPHCPPHSSRRGFVLSPPHPFSSTPSSLTSPPPPGSTRAWHSPPLAHTPPFSASLLLRPALSRLLARSLARSPHSGPPCSCLSSRPLSPLPLSALLPVLLRLALLIAALAELSLLLCRCPRSSPSPSALPAPRLCLLTPSGLAAPGSLLRSAPSPALPDRLLPPPVFSRAFPSTSDSLPPSPSPDVVLPATVSPLRLSLRASPQPVFSVSLPRTPPHFVCFPLRFLFPSFLLAPLSCWLPSVLSPPLHSLSLFPSLSSLNLLLLSLSPPRHLPSHWPPFL